MAPPVIPAKAGIQFFPSPAWMPASAGMTNWVALVAAYCAHVHLAHISPNLASPEGVGFQPSPKETLKKPYPGRYGLGFNEMVTRWIFSMGNKPRCQEKLAR